MTHATLLTTHTRDQYDVIRARLDQSIGVVQIEALRIKIARDSIAPFARRFDPDARRLWHQLDDWLNGLEAALTDAGERP